MTINVQPMELNGHWYYTVQQFAALIGKSEQTVYTLKDKGNAIRKLRSEDFMGKPMIPVEEFTEFVFTGPGRYPLSDLYRFLEDGSTVPVETMEIVRAGLDSGA